MNSRGNILILGIIAALIIGLGAATAVVITQNTESEEETENQTNGQDTITNLQLQVSELKQSIEDLKASSSDIQPSEEMPAVRTGTNAAVLQNINAAPPNEQRPTMANATAGDAPTQTSELTTGQSIVNNDFDLNITLDSVDTDAHTAVLIINYADGSDSRWQNNNPGATGWFPNPATYPESTEDGESLLDQADFVYRAHYYCDGSIKTDAQPVGAFEKINLSGGYSNFVCRNRQHEQCETDGTFDHYYDERCDYGAVTFSQNAATCSSNFAIRISTLTVTGATIDIAPRSNTQNCSSVQF